MTKAAMIACLPAALLLLALSPVSLYGVEAAEGSVTQAAAPAGGSESRQAAPAGGSESRQAAPTGGDESQQETAAGAGADRADASVSMGTVDKTAPGPGTGDLQTEEGAGYNEDSRIQEILSRMTTEEKAAQLFVLLPEQLTGYEVVTQAGDATKAALDQYPVGGLIYMGPNIQSEDQVREMIQRSQQYSQERIGLPLFICVDEEGGDVQRIGGKLPSLPWQPAMWTVGESGDPEQARAEGVTIGTALRDLGFNVDLAPVADVVKDPGNSAIGTRSFGPDATSDAAMVKAFTEGIQSTGIEATLKHFPGHGATASDSHTGAAVSYDTLDQIQDDLLPFRSGIEAGCRFVMAGHISYPNITGDGTPASLSPFFLTQILRQQIGFDGLIITDALRMAAVADRYDSAAAAVTSFLAGADLLLMPADFQSAMQGIVSAVNSGQISEERLDQSLSRILQTKLKLMDEPEA